MSSGLNFLYSNIANACAVSIAGIIPSSWDNSKPAVIASSSVMEINSALSDLNKFNPIKISAKNKQNIESLTNEIKIYINNLTSQIDNSTITNSRHYDLLNKTYHEIHKVKISISKNISSDLLAIDIKQAIYFLGELTGEISNNEVLGNIFSKFCIGK